MDANDETGLTLVELLVALVIVGILAAVATPALTRDNLQGEFERVVGRLQHDLVRIKYEAAAKREDHALRLMSGATGYELVAVDRSAPPNYALVRAQQVQGARVRIRGVKTCAAVPGSGTCSAAGAITRGEIRFSSVSDVAACTGASCTPTPSAASVFIESDDGSYRARLVVYQSTGYVKRYEGW